MSRSLIHTGMRISEFCGLTVKDIDFTNHTINIDKQVIRTKDMNVIVQETKTVSGKRILPMKAEVEECFKSIIRERTARLKSEENVIHLEQTVGGYSGFLFIDDNGLPLVAMHWEHRLHNMVNRYNQIYKVQMPKITPHVCRHTYCSNMARKGMNPKTLQYLMGHSDISVTLNVYTHLGLQDAVEEMTRLQDLERAREEQERMDGENSAADDEGSSMVI